MEKLISENQIEFSNAKREKTKIQYKINLIYDSKLKSNATSRIFRRKTRNLNQSRARNYLIDRSIKGFSFHNFKNKVRRSRVDFFRFSPQNLDFKYSVDAEMSLEE